MKNFVHDNNLNRQVAGPMSNHETTGDTGYYVHVSRKTDDRDWDEFLARNPCSNHVQTSMWAQVKLILGWETLRFMVRHKGQIARRRRKSAVSNCCTQCTATRSDGHCQPIESRCTKG